MLTIRLTRKGKKNQPFFRVVLIDKRRSTKGGRSVEDLGYVDPLKKRRSFNKERIQYWISKGAQTSATIHNLLVSEKIIEAKKIHILRLSKKKVAEMEAKKTSADAKALADKAETQKAVVETEVVESAMSDIAQTEGTEKETPPETPQEASTELASAESSGEAKPAE